MRCNRIEHLIIIMTNHATEISLKEEINSPFFFLCLKNFFGAYIQRPLFRKLNVLFFIYVAK